MIGSSCQGSDPKEGKDIKRVCNAEHSLAAAPPGARDCVIVR